MEPSHYGPFEYTPSTQRRNFSWPNNAKIALLIIPNVECFALNTQMPAGEGNIPDVSAWGILDYGNCIGVFRMIEVMVKYGVPGTVALNSDCCDVYPDVVEACLKHGWELMGHCESNTHRLSGEKTEDDAHNLIRRTLDRIESFSGVRPRGWLGAGRQETWQTLDQLVTEGCIYTPDWDNDDQPIVMNVSGSKFVGLPYGAGVSDKQHFEIHHGSTDNFEQMIREAFDVLYAESSISGRVNAISLHPYIIGVPHRIRALDRALEHIMSHEDVWATTGGEIADWLLSGKAYEN